MLMKWFSGTMAKKMNQQIIDIKSQIDSLKEYIDTELCKKCEEMKSKLDQLNCLLDSIENEQNK